LLIYVLKHRLRRLLLVNYCLIIDPT